MGFSGGGGAGALPAHEHTNIPLDGGPLDFVNTTIGSLSAGSMTFSDGAALQELVVANPGDSLVVNGGGTAPEWSTPASGAWTLLDDQTTTGATNTFHVVFSPQASYTTYSYIKCVLSIETTGGTGNTGSVKCEVNSLVANYDTQGSKVEGGATSYVNRTGEAAMYIVDSPNTGDFSALIEMDFKLPVYASSDEVICWAVYASEVAVGSYTNFVSGTGNTIQTIDIDINNSGGTPNREMRLQTYGIKS